MKKPINNASYQCLLLSDFNIDNFIGYLQNGEESPHLKAELGPAGPVMRVLSSGYDSLWLKKFDAVFIWSLPQVVSASFMQALSSKKVSLEQVLIEVDLFIKGIEEFSKTAKYIFIPTWVVPTYERNKELTDLLMQMNFMVDKNLKEIPNVFTLDTQKWIETAGKNAFNPKLWYMGKVAFGNEVFLEAMKDFKSALKALNGQARKLIIVDLDDTLWGGIVGEIGWETLRLGGHDHIGEAYADFQQALKTLTNRGIILGIVSKNEEAVALEAIKNHPEMILKIDDFAGWKINWQDKAQNIIELVRELNLGLDSAVFIDNSPVERARVREALPEVFVPDWPEDCMLYRSTLFNLRVFDTLRRTEEDLKRAGMYAAERERTQLKTQAGSLDNWLKGLEIKIKAEELNDVNLPRVVQLLNKTNQMNLRTRRLSEKEFMAWIKAKGYKRRLWAFYVSDKFGQYGLTGIVSLEAVGRQSANVEDFVLSCRVVGRKVEETMLYFAIKFAKELDVDEVRANYRKTEKNKPCLEFFQKSKFERFPNSDVFRWKTNNDYPFPDVVELLEEKSSYGRKTQFAKK